jgi:hypothetical protein
MRTMIDLKRISEGKQKREPRVLLYGGDGVGKTRFSAGAPDPFFLDVNKGSFAYDVKRVVPESWPEVLEWVGAVERGEVKCKSLVIDAVGDLEYLGNAEFFPGTTIDKWDGGYGRGETYALTRWRELLGALERVWNTGKTVILVGHMKVKHFDDPSGPGFDRFQLSMRDQVAGLLRQWCDYVLFAREEISQQKVGADLKIVTSGVRWIHTHRSTAFDAKSRGTTLFPERILLSWDEFAKARSADAERAEILRKEIDAMLTEIGDKKLDEQVKEYLRANPGMIVEARNRVAARLEESRTSNITNTTNATNATNTKEESKK